MMLIYAYRHTVTGEMGLYSVPTTYTRATLICLFSYQVRNQDAFYVLGGISLEGREVAWAWLKVCYSFRVSGISI